ncbi:hypothetical protein E4U10_008017 [Claviceps purpurea]|nr:hypothetical protein E4U37_006435 [Claviceps purpurea]KAG6162447.1 hypothetical protein E4U11_002638 [Claviceps purpurea]KAG6176035.1 hypothetical protein E4U36_008295 [Claviceps purpurea]KAG6197709.1 hypothetical protein E4U10_008017 [Claviceps purpurea]KAG6232506.1 hypothetical protein E4U26_004985 [Claviceps purpurea]
MNKADRKSARRIDRRAQTDAETRTETKNSMEVIPCAAADQVIPVDNIRTRTFFIVEECLDEEALRTALDQLIRKHWRKLGGRLIRRKDKLLEYHIPKAFDKDYVLFNWSTQEYSHSIDKFVPAIRSPPLDKGPQFLPPLETLDDHFRPSSWPYHRRDDPPDSPLLYVHVSLFPDATVIATSIPHPVVDQMGMANIIKACMGIVQGIDPPAFVGYEGDLLPGQDKAYKDYPTSEVCRTGYQRILRTGEYPLILLPLIPDLILHREERNLLFLPMQMIRALRDKYSKALAEMHSDYTRISDSDVVTALITKLSRMSKKTPRTLCLSQTMNLRGLVPELSPERSAGFIHNCLHTSTARFRIDPSTPARDIAYANRKAIEKSRDPRDIEIGMVVEREMVRIRQGSHVCEPFDRSYHVSNWCAAWNDVDFGPIVKGERKEAGGKPKFLVLGQSGERWSPLRLSALILSKTEEGYWVQFAASVPAMKLIKKHLADDPTLENF